VRFDLQAFWGSKWYYAEYSTFTVRPESSNYRLHVSGFSGNVGLENGKSAFEWHNGLMFTTMDRDNDPLSWNCAVEKGSGFWYSRCGWCDVNSVRRRYSGQFFWSGLYKGKSDLRSSRMWLKCK